MARNKELFEEEIFEMPEEDEMTRRRTEEEHELSYGW